MTQSRNSPQRRTAISGRESVHSMRSVLARWSQWRHRKRPLAVSAAFQSAQVLIFNSMSGIPNVPTWTQEPAFSTAFLRPERLIPAIGTKVHTSTAVAPDKLLTCTAAENSVPRCLFFDAYDDSCQVTLGQGLVDLSERSPSNQARTFHAISPAEKKQWHG